jgi:sugar lactone lactonase YvrE
MYSLRMRPALFVVALFMVAGCNGGGTSPSLTSGSPGMSSYVHSGVPFAPAVHHAGLRQSTSGTYSTKGSLVFEGDQAEAQTNIYRTGGLPGNPAPVAAIKAGAGCPYGIAADKSDTIYIADNCGGNDVELFAKGSTTMKSKITNGISNPLGLAFDSAQNLYVSNYPAAITVYPLGSTTPSETITGGGLTDPFGLAVDSSGNLYIADFGAHAVFEVAAGTTTVTNLNLSGLTEPLGVAVDQAHGDLWVTDGQGDRIQVYQLGSTTPFQTINGTGFPYAISLQNPGRRIRRDEVVSSDINLKEFFAYEPGQYSPYATETNGVSLPTGLLITHL